MSSFLIFLLLQLCYAWNLFLSDRLYENIKLQSSSPPLLVLLSSDNNLLRCATVCFSRNDCQAANWYQVTKDTFICELLGTSICTNASDVSVKPQPKGRVWEKASNPRTNITCLDQICTNLPLNCSGITSEICDHCTRSCQHCWQRYNNGTATKQYRCTIWPEGISKAHLTTWCYTGSQYFIMRKYLQYGVPDPKYYQNMSVFDMARIVRTGVYKSFNFVMTMQNSSKPRGVYQFEGDGLDNQGRLSISFSPSAFPETNSDVLQLMGQPLVKAPFVNNSDVLPSCGPFWLLPQGNATCPGGSIRFWTDPKILSNGTVTDVGVWWPSAGSPSNVIQAAISLG